ncbi:MAG: NAD(P)-dependent oxidoreductase, partial [Enterobacteriaceae bacterium]
MSTTAITLLDHLTLSNAPLQFNFPHTLTSHALCQDQDATDKALQGQAIAITNKVKITRELIQRHPELKMIAVAATGYNNIDIEAARAAGITVTNVAGYSTVSVAEHALMLMLNLAHRLPVYHDKVREGQWQQSPMFTLPGPGYHQLTHKTLVLIGYCAIGKAVAKLAQAFGMRIVLAGRKGRQECPEGYTEFHQALRQADIISLVNEQAVAEGLRSGH